VIVAPRQVLGAEVDAAMILVIPITFDDLEPITHLAIHHGHALDVARAVEGVTQSG
jgi:hypothetical protein